MPNLNPVVANIQVGSPHTLYSNPKDASGFPTTPTTDYAWSFDGNQALATLVPGGVHGQNAVFTALAPGLFHIHASNSPASGGEIENWDLTAQSGPYDHDVPSIDAPV